MRRSIPSALAVAAFLVAAACGQGTQSAGTSVKPAEVGAQDIERNPTESIEQMLQRKASGLLVKQTPDGIAVTVRGATSYNGQERPPLWILNGNPYSPGPGGVLSGIDPYEIESIKLLRTADAAIYGIDAANGVIVITTKKPGRRP